MRAGDEVIGDVVHHAFRLVGGAPRSREIVHEYPSVAGYELGAIIECMAPSCGKRFQMGRSGTAGYGWREVPVPDEPPRTWELTLTQYQRDNLLQLINVCGWPSTFQQADYEVDSLAVAPFNVMNTGDWLGEIGHMLAADNAPGRASFDAERTGDPLQSRAKTAERVHAWFLEQEADWNDE